MCNQHSQSSRDSSAQLPRNDSASDAAAESSRYSAARAGKSSIAARALERAIIFYQRRISALKPMSTCRFEPTCSGYSLEAVRRFGALRGSWLALLRILRCAPWHPGGWDPVPPDYPGVGSWWRRMHR